MIVVHLLLISWLINWSGLRISCSSVFSSEMSNGNIFVSMRSTLVGPIVIVCIVKNVNIVSVTCFVIHLNLSFLLLVSVISVNDEKLLNSNNNST